MQCAQSLSTMRSAVMPAACGRLDPRASVFGDSRERSAARDERWTGLLPWQVKQVRDYVDADLGGRMSLSLAASRARLSPGYFSRCFRQAFGVTFSRFVAARRVERAQGLMIGGAGKLCEIALACGFADQAHFTRTFAGLTGCTPARWRRQAAMRRLSA